MPQNRPDLIKRFIGVASNTITHRILVRGELEEDTRKHHTKEIERDIDISLRYRDMINPIGRALPQGDSEEIRKKIALKVRAELLKRIEKGYTLDISSIDDEINRFLDECKVI